MSLGCRRGGGGGRYKCGSGCGCPSSDIPAYSQQVVRPIPTLADLQARATAGHFGRLPGFLNLHTIFFPWCCHRGMPAKLVSTAVQALLTYITVIHYVNTMGFIPTGI